MDAINLLPSRDFSYETLDFIDTFFQKNLSGGAENNFRKLLFELFEGKGLNTKTKKSDLYTTLENKLEEINHLVREIPRDIIATNWTFKALSGEEPSPEDTLKAERVAMLSGVIQGSLKIKVIARYEKLLPKRRTKDFKEKYPLLENAFKMYEQYNFNQEAEQKYMTIHNNNGISDIVQHLHLNKFKDEHRQQFEKYGSVEIKYITPKGSEISLNVDTGEGIGILHIANQVNDLIGVRQSLLIMYIMSLAFKQSKDKNKPTSNVSIDIKEYCKLRGINYRSDTADVIYEDIEKLKRILIRYEYKDERGKNKFIEKSPLLSNRGISGDIHGNVIDKRIVEISLNVDTGEGIGILHIANQVNDLIGVRQSLLIMYIMSLAFKQERDKNKPIEKSPLLSNRGISGDIHGNVIDKRIVNVSLGAWIDTLSYSQYQHINKDFFKCNLKNNNGSYVPIGLYLNCLLRNNLKNSNSDSTVFKVKVNKLTLKLGIDENTIKKGGYNKKLKVPLEKVLTNLEGLGYQWTYKNGVHSSRKEFEEDTIIFKNPELDKIYKEKGYKKKTS